MYDPIKYIITLLILCSSANLYAQVSEQYVFGFDFKEGIYTSFSEFKNNSPAVTQYRVIVKNEILYNNFTSERIINQLQGRNKFGLWIDIDENDVWGICHEDQVYVYIDKAFHEITKIGALMFVTIVFKGQYDVLSFSAGDTYVGRGKGAEMINYLIDFETGKYYLYKLKNFTKLLERDKELYDEFMAINGKKQKKYHMLMYLEKFNDRNPISFPIEPF